MASLPTDAWFVVQVMPQSERRVASILEYKGYQQFSPTYLVRKRWSDRIKSREAPLFPGYVFVRSPAAGVRGLVSSTPGVTRILGFGGSPCPVPDREMTAIRRLSLQGQAFPIPYVEVGQRVEIREGPFAGVVGIVRRIKSRSCLIVSVELISRSIYVVVDEFQIGRASAAVGATSGA
jgi:transcriptional antiterminator RfaH